MISIIYIYFFVLIFFICDFFYFIKIFVENIFIYELD